MFHVDVTMEDTRIIAHESHNPTVLDVLFVDNLTGKNFLRPMTMETLGRVLLIGLAGIDSEEIPAFTYDSVAAEFVDCPNECRPIP
jgi:hypothetical protein